MKKIKLIKSDIHPEGIFLYESDNKVYIRFLSIHNGKVFIEEKFINGYRKSKTTNIVEIGDLSFVDRSLLLRFVEKFKNIFLVKNLKKQSVIVRPPATKN